MPIKIEQVTRKGLVVNDYDTKLKPTELKKLLSKQANLVGTPCFWNNLHQVGSMTLAKVTYA
jgi:hypothetical protein